VFGFFVFLLCLLRGLSNFIYKSAVFGPKESKTEENNGPCNFENSVDKNQMENGTKISHITSTDF
jgi:Na+-transporting methylmalonyl-CoA/oxaloacetate decarboxylase gamma subunit